MLSGEAGSGEAGVGSGKVGLLSAEPGRLAGCWCLSGRKTGDVQGPAVAVEMQPPTPNGHDGQQQVRSRVMMLFISTHLTEYGRSVFQDLSTHPCPLSLLLFFLPQPEKRSVRSGCALLFGAVY